MTQGWRGGVVDTSSLAVRALACALLLLAIGALGPKRQRPMRRSTAGTTTEALAAEETGSALLCPGVMTGSGKGRPTND
jgi:hypothetical protein